MKKWKCSHIQAPYNWDIYLCDLNDKVCLLESGDRCEIYEELLKKEQDG